MACFRRRYAVSGFSIRNLTCLSGVALFAACAALPQLGHAQNGHSTHPSSSPPASSGDAPCSPSWPDRNSARIKISDSLVLSIPAKYLRYGWLSRRDRGDANLNGQMSKNTGLGSASFDFFLPDFSGYTTERLRERFDINAVQVAYVVAAKQIEVDPNHPAHYPSNQLKNTLRYLADKSKYRDMYGLRCYEGRTLKSRMYCYSMQAGKDHEGILLSVDVPPYGRSVVNPLVWTNYFSKRYGGIEISWHASVKNLSRWRDIDRQIWHFLDIWNVAGKPLETR